MIWEHLFLENLYFFAKIWTRERCVFRERTFCRQKMGITAVIFYEKSEKTDILLTYLAHNIFCYFDRIDFIWTKYGHGSRGFFMKKLKKRHKSTVFLREWTFWENMGMRALWFLEKWRFFYKIWAWEQSMFFREWTYFWQNMGMR